MKEAGTKENMKQVKSHANIYIYVGAANESLHKGKYDHFSICLYMYIKYFYCIHSCVKLQEHIKFVGDFSVSFSMQGIACLGNYKTCLSMKKGDLILVMEFTLLTVLQSA